MLMNKKGIFQLFFHPSLWLGVLRFGIGIILFLLTQPMLVKAGLPPAVASIILIGVLIGLGIWSYFKIPL